MNHLTFSLFKNKLDTQPNTVVESWDLLLNRLRKPQIRNNKDGSLLCGAVFNGTRSKDNAVESNLLILDFDHVDEIDLSIWEKLNLTFASYTTFSHATPDKKCAYRVVIPLNKSIPKEKYPFLFQWAFDITNGLIDPACKDISRMQYLPACPKERSSLFESFQATGIPLEWETIIYPYEVRVKNVTPIRNIEQQKVILNANKDYSKYIEKAVDNEINNVRCAAQGSRNKTLNNSAFALGQLVSASWANVSQSQIEGLLFDAAISTGLTSHEANAVIRCGLSKGMETPREQPIDSLEVKTKETKKKTNVVSIKVNEASNDTNVETVIYPLDEPLKKDLFYHFNKEKNPSCTLDNLKVILKYYGFQVRYNEISKREEITLKSTPFMSGDADNISISRVTSACIVNNMSVTHLPLYLLDIAHENTYNPVKEWIESKPWDGESRLGDLEDTIEQSSEISDDLFKLLLRKWLISAVAAAYNCHGNFRSKGVLVFQGKQSLGKTPWFKRLAPQELKVIKDGVNLDVGNKDSVLKVISHWIVELGELDATFKKSEIAQLKAFITEDSDIVRRPYAKKDSHFPRQTVFCGSVNEQDFLKDSTGNVRFWTIPVTYLDYEHGIDMQQLWAEIATFYLKGEKWWLTKEQENQLEENNALFVEENRFADKVSHIFNYNTDKSYRLKTDEALKLIGIHNPTKQDIREMNQQLTKMFGEKKKSKADRYFLSHWVIKDNYD